MSYLHDDLEQDEPRASAYNPPQRELTLSTATLLGIFFGLALLCAVFFGFGYSMGTRAHQAPVVATDSVPVPDNSSTFSAFSKPSPGSPAATTTTGKPAPIVDAPPSTHTTEPKPEPAPAPIVRVPTTPAPTSTKPAEPAPARAPSSAAETGLTFVVQIAAVSHQEDAELLVNALKRKGYTVAARSEPQDKLFHIQIGPFATKKDADAMRLRLQSDGYNAMVK